MNLITMEIIDKWILLFYKNLCSKVSANIEERGH